MFSVYHSSKPPSWFSSPSERWCAVNDLNALGPRCIAALSELVETQGLRRTKPSAMFMLLEDHGFCFVRELNEWSKAVEIRPSLWGEEALELLESVLTMTKQKKLKTDLTPLQLDILFAAVQIARGDQIRTVKALKARLLQIWPKKPKSITVALKYWSKYETAKPGVLRR
jgi:hypothetical protein